MKKILLLSLLLGACAAVAQIQMDSNANGGTMTEWVDRVRLSAW